MPTASRPEDRPIIGITTSFEEDEQRLHYAYVQAVENAGGLPLIIPMLQSPTAMKSLTDLLDGLLISGGPAIEEGLIGTLPDDIDLPAPVRKVTDKHILAQTLKENKPVLGICYGMQLLNAAAGGTLYADVQRDLKNVGAHSPKRGSAAHDILFEPQSHLYRLLSQDRMQVNSRHIQAVCTVPSPYRVAAFSEDGLIEAIENNDGSIIGVQFHPERMGDAMKALFENLVTCARRWRQRRAGLEA